jgi:hypothetical protein
MGKQQLNWLLPRIPQTKDLSLVGLEYNIKVSALNTCNCPMLQVRMQQSRSSIFMFLFPGVKWEVHPPVPATADLSGCWKLSDAGLIQLGMAGK